MKNILVLVLGLISLSLNAQMPGGQRPGGGSAPMGRIYGKIVDASNKGIDAASVTLITSRPDSVTKKPTEVIIGGMLTNATGDFSIENIPAMGRYTLRVSGIGFKGSETAVAFSRPAPGADPSAMLSALDKDLGNIKLAVDEQVLGTVTVTATRPQLQMGIDRKIFNVDRNLVSAGGTAVDIMKNVPSVSVDIDGNVTLRNAAPQIFVDGRPTNLTLEQIPSDAIESVEIITNPSAKFDASGGTAGILNIVLKKNRRVGYSGNIRANIDSRARVGLGGDINLRQNKVNFFINGNYNQRKSIGEGSTFRTDFGNNTQTDQYDNSTFTGAFGFGRAGFDYFIDNRNTLTINGSMARGTMRPNNSSLIYTDTSINGTLDLLQERMTMGENRFRNMGAQMSFKHNFPQAGREWTADVTYNKGRNNNTSNISNDFFIYNNPNKIFDRRFAQQQVGEGINDNLVVQTDYVNPLNDHSKFEVGARLSIRDVASTTNYFIVNPDNTKVPITTQDVTFDSRDRVYAAYGSYSNRIKNFGFQLGLRAESSDYQGLLVNKGQSFNIEFPISLFPSLFLTQKLGEADELQFNYSRRINRPNFWQLFPFIDITDSINVNRGNPGLSPEFTNSLELSYSKTFKNRDNFLASIYFKNTNDLITRIQQREFVEAFNDSAIVTSFVNANQSYTTGLELIGRNKVAKFWDLTTNFNLFTSNIDLVTGPDPEQLVSYFVKINNSFRLPHNISIQLSGDYQSKVITSPGGRGGGGGGFGGGMFGGGGGNSAAQGFIRPNYGVDAGIRFEFLKERKASISLNVNDIFRTRLFDSYSETDFFVQNSQRRRDPQVFRLNFNYRFGKFDASLFKRKNTRADGNIDMGTQGQ